MAAILSQPECVKPFHVALMYIHAFFIEAEQNKTCKMYVNGFQVTNNDRNSMEASGFILSQVQG